LRDPVLTGREISHCVAERALAKVHPKGECLIFDGELDAYGRGVIREQRDKVRRKFKAHRVAYAMVHGGVPRGKVVMHTCDRPACVNASHLRAATQQESLADCRAKGRARGRLSEPV